jgi:hypothetical protein
MKFFIALLATLYSVTSFATTSETNIYDLQYLPEKRVSFGISDLVYTNTQYRQGGYATRVDTASLIQTLGHSFTNRFSMSLSGAYSKERTQAKYSYSSYNSSSHSTIQGVSDPVLNFKYRLQDDYFRFDLLGGLLFNSGASTEDNNKLGSNRLNLGFNFGQKYELLQWMVLMNVYHQMQNGSQDAYNYYKFDAAWLWYVGEYSLIKFYATTYVSDIIGRGNRSTITSVQTGPEYQYLFTENFLMRTGIAYSTSQLTSRDAKINDGWIYSLGLNYQF